MAGKQNEVEVDVGMDVHHEAITRAFNDIDKRLKSVQAQMVQVSKTAVDAAINFKTTLNGQMAGFNKNISILEKFEKNINGPQRRQMQQWDKEELAANRLAAEKSKLRKQDDAAARKRLADIELEERRTNQFAEQQRKFREQARKKEEADKNARLRGLDEEEKAFNRLQESKRKLRERDAKVATGNATSDARPDRALSNRELRLELNASRDLLDIGARRAFTQGRINELLQRRQLLSGAERKAENDAIQHEIVRLRLIDQRIDKLRREHEQQMRNDSRTPAAPGGGGGGSGLFGNAGLTGVFARTAGYGAAAAAIYGTISALRDGAQFALQFEDAMARLGAISGATATQVHELGKSITDVAKNSRFSTLELAEAATTLAQAGFTQGEIQSTLQSISQLATASGVTIAEATDVVTAAIGSFQLQASETSHINDVLASALNRTKLNIQQVALGIQYAGATAHENNISFEELTATMAVMANSGIRSGSTIGTGIRQFLVDLQTPTEKLTKQLEELGLTMADIDVNKLGLPEVLDRMAAKGFDSAAAYGALETRAAAAYLVLRNNREEIYEQIQAQNQIGQSAEAAAKGQASLSAEWQRSKNILNGYVEGGLKPLAEGLRDFLKGFNDNQSDETLQGLWAAYNNAENNHAKAEAFRDLQAYSDAKEELGEVEERHADRIERTTTALNKATDAVGAQRTKLASLDEAMARVYIRHDELSRGGMGLSAEVATLTTRFAGLASHLDGTAISFGSLTAALTAYRLEEMKLLGNRLLTEGIKGRENAAAFNSQATDTMRTMRREGVFNELPQNVRQLVQRVRANPRDGNLRRTLSDAAGRLEGNQKSYVQRWLTNIDQAVSTSDAASRSLNQADLVTVLRSPALQRRQEEVSGLAGQSDDVIRRKIAQLQSAMDTARTSLAKQAFATLITQAQGYIGSGTAPQASTGSSSSTSAAERAANREAQLISFTSPVRGPVNVTSGVGARARPRGQNGQAGSADHQGVDISGKVGDPVLATADGYVKFAGTQRGGGGYGNYIILDHGGGTTTLYGHLSEILVNRGDQVSQGQIIGRVGQSGTATAPHLHYERKTSSGIDRNPLSPRAKGNISEIAQGAERVLEEEERRAEQNEAAGNRLRVGNAERDLKTSIDLLKNNTAASADELNRVQVEAAFAEWEAALREQLETEDDRRDATDNDRLDHIRELDERIAQRREELENAYFDSFFGGIEGALDSIRRRWASEEAARQQNVGLAQARLSGLQLPENRDRVPGYVVGYQQRRVEMAERDARRSRLASLPGQAAELDTQWSNLYARASSDMTLDPNELKQIADKMRDLSEEAAELRRQYALLNAEENAAKDVPKGFTENARMWLDNFRQANGLEGSLGFKWSDLFSGMDSAMQTAQSSLGGFFSDVINRTKSVGEAFGDMKDAVLRAIGDMIAQLLAKKAFQIITGLASSLFGAPPVVGKIHGGQVKAYSGRYITAGVPNRDSVDARIAKGEYVVRKSAVDSVGVDFMDRLNERGSHALKGLAGKPLVMPRAEQKMNVYVVAPEHQPQMGPNDVLVTIANDIASGGMTKQLIKHVSQGG